MHQLSTSFSTFNFAKLPPKPEENINTPVVVCESASGGIDVKQTDTTSEKVAVHYDLGQYLDNSPNIWLIIYCFLCIL